MTWHSLDYNYASQTCFTAVIGGACFIVYIQKAGGAKVHAGSMYVIYIYNIGLLRI